MFRNMDANISLNNTETDSLSTTNSTWTLFARKLERKLLFAATFVMR